MEYICEDCKEIFDESDIIIKKYNDRVEYWGTMVDMPSYERLCPYCRSEEIEEYRGELDDE